MASSTVEDLGDAAVSGVACPPRDVAERRTATQIKPLRTLIPPASDSLTRLACMVLQLYFARYATNNPDISGVPFAPNSAVPGGANPRGYKV